MAVKGFHELMLGGKTVFNLPRAQQLKCGDFAKRMDMLKRQKREPAKWAAYHVIHSLAFLQERHHGERRSETATRCREKGLPVFNANFQFSAVAERDALLDNKPYPI
eukprot:8629448-Pyramimonas_sp.AAC.1